MADHVYSDHGAVLPGVGVGVGMGVGGSGSQQQQQQLLLLKDIVTPHENDVLSGRGNFVNYHSGNEHFRSLVKKHKIAYVACPKPEKGKFSRLIVDEIRSMSPPGRFLKQDPTTKLWYDIGDKKALDKTRQALREGAPELIRELHGDADDVCVGGVVVSGGAASGLGECGGQQGLGIGMGGPGPGGNGGGGVIPTLHGSSSAFGLHHHDPYAALHAQQQQMLALGMGGASPQMQAAFLAKAQAEGIMTKSGMVYTLGGVGDEDGIGTLDHHVGGDGGGMHQLGGGHMGLGGACGFGGGGEVGGGHAMPSPQVQMQLAAAAQRFAAAHGLPPSAAASIINQIPLEALEPTPINPYRGDAVSVGGGGGMRLSSMDPPPNVALHGVGGVGGGGGMGGGSGGGMAGGIRGMGQSSSMRLGGGGGGGMGMGMGMIMGMGMGMNMGAGGGGGMGMSMGGGGNSFLVRNGAIGDEEDEDEDDGERDDGEEGGGERRRHSGLAKEDYASKQPDAAPLSSDGGGGEEAAAAATTSLSLSDRGGGRTGAAAAGGGGDDDGGGGGFMRPSLAQQKNSLPPVSEEVTAAKRREKRDGGGGGGFGGSGRKKSPMNDAKRSYAMSASSSISSFSASSRHDRDRGGAGGGGERGGVERRDSITLEDVKKASISLQSMKNMAMSSTQMSFSVGDLDSNLSAAFEDSLVIGSGTAESVKKDSVKAREESAAIAAARGVAAAAAVGGGDGGGGGGGGSVGGMQPPQQRAARGLPRGYMAAAAVAVGGGDSSSLGPMKHFGQSAADMSFNFSDATDTLGASAMGMSYRFEEEEK